MSGCLGGLVAISNVSSGVVIRLVSDHQGAPITDLQAAPNLIQVRNLRGIPQFGDFDCIVHLQLPSLGENQCMLWLAASGDRRVSIWSADWRRDMCQLVDWLTFPGPATDPNGTRLKRGPKVCKCSPLFLISGMGFICTYSGLLLIPVKVSLIRGVGSSLV